MRRLFSAALLVAAIGCGKSGTQPPKPDDVKGYLKADPIDKKAFEAAILGRSTREVSEMLGTPTQVLNGEKRTGWEYPINPHKQSGVIVFFRDDKAVQIDWRAN
jgi:hypothetical protein